MNSELKGVIPAVASPCDQQDVFLEDVFSRLVEHLYSQGVHGMYVCGATGDGPNMRLHERKRAAEIAVASSKLHNGTAIIHVGATNTRDAVELAEHAAQVGADAVASIPPINRSQQQLVQYYSDICRAASIPVLVYHIPVLTKHEPTVDEMLELLDIDGVVGLKLTDWNLFFMKRILLARPGTVVFNGYDEFFVPGLLYGAQGGIGTWYNLFPKLYLAMFEAIGAGNYGAALKLQDLLLQFTAGAWKHGIIATFEILMRESGLAMHCFRRPRILPDLDTQADIVSELRPVIEMIEASC